jgi:putative DNA-invertase from lambdoid prophage Rac
VATWSGARRQIEGYAHMHALTLADVLIEEGVSGSVPVEERPVGGALFAELVRGDIVIAAKLDRYSGRPSMRSRSSRA